MAIKFLCEGCGRIVVVQDSIAGSPVKCPNCSARIIAPGRNAPADTDSGMPKGLLEDTSENPCPHCGQTIKSAARKCPFCGETLDELLKARESASSSVQEPLDDGIEYKWKAENMSLWALIIAIVGWFTCAIALEPVALLLAQKALKTAAKTDLHVKKGAAYVATVIGIIGLVLQTIGIIVYISSRH